jgi:fibronectin-binding autotransporter adhesin
MVIRMRPGSWWAVAAIAVAGSLMLGISSASAQATYYWDGNNDTSGFGTASGTWADPTAGTLTSGWSLSSNGTVIVDGNSVSTTTVGSLNFGTNTALFGLGAGTINVSGTVNAGNITIGTQSGAITLSGGTINLGAAATINTGTLTIDSLITGAATSLTKAGGGTLRLTNTANNYTGATLIGQSTGGVLEATALANGGVASSIGASSNAAGNLVLSNINAGVLRYVGVTNASTDRLFTLGNQQGYAGGFEVSGTGTLNLANTGSVAFAQANQARLFSLGGTNAGQNIANTLLIDNGTGVLSFIKGGVGTWVLANNANSYTGNTTLNGGVLSVSKMADYDAVSAIGKGNASAAAIVLNGGTLNYTGNGDSTNRLIQASGTNGSILNNGSGALNFTATGNFNVQGSTSSSRTLTFGGSNGGAISGAIQNNTGTAPALNLAKTGSGTWTLSGSNTYTGTTTINAGTLKLDYATNNTSKLSDTAALTLGGGMLELSGGSHTEIVASTTISANVGTKVQQTSGSSVLQMGVITRNNSSTLSFSADNIATTSTTNTNGILGTWATVGNNWAVNSANGANGLIVGLSSYTALPTTGGAGSVNYQLTGNQTQTGDVTTNTVRLVNSANSDVLNLGTRALNLGSGTGGLMYAGGFNDHFTIAGTTGAIKSQTPNNQIVVNVFTGTLTVDALLNAGSAVTSKFGAGTLVVGGNNTSSGAFHHQEGVLRLTHSNALGTTGGGVVVQDGATLELANSVAIGVESATITGTGVSNGGAFRNVASNTSSYAGAITLGVGGARINSDPNGSLTLSGGVVTNTLRDAFFGGAGDTAVSTAAISGAGNVIKDGNGALSLSAANTYTGATNVNAGTLDVSGAGSINSTSAINVAAGGRFAHNSSVALALAPTLNGDGAGSRAIYGGTGTLNAALTLDNGGDVLSPGNSPGIMTFGVNQSWGSYSYDWELNDWTSKVAGTNIDQINITGGLTLAGATPGSYILNVLSLTGGGVTGNVPDFADVNNSWTILTTTTGISGFNASFWTINTGTFTSSPTATGTWSIAQSGNNLILNYVAVPEPATIALVASGAMIVGSLLARRRRVP